MQCHLRPVCRWLTYSSSDDIDTSEEEEAPTALRATPDAQVRLEEDEEEDFQMVPLDDEHWTTEEMPDRTVCIHEHALPHGLCQYLCPYAATYFLPMPKPWIWVTFPILRLSWSHPAMRTYQHFKILHTEKPLVCIEHYIDFKLFNLYPLLN